MTEEFPPSPEPGDGDAPARGGIGSLAAGTLGSIFDYLEARLSLFRIEATEARGRIVRRVIAAVAGAFFLLVAYAAAIVGAVAWISDHFGKPWPLVTLAAAGAHLLAGLLLLLAAKKRFGDPPFRDSLGEFQRDRQWLRRQSETPGRPRPR